MSGHKIEDPKQALAYMLAGRATVTFKSLKTSDHLTFQVKRPKKAMNGITHFIQVRTGNDFARIGLIREGIARSRFETMRNADLPPDSKEVRAFAWVFNAISDHNVVPPALEVWHEGTCGRCARPLTDPDSIASGFGPECRQKFKCEAA